MKRNSLAKDVLLLSLLAFFTSCAPETNQTDTSTNDPKLTSNVIYGSDGRLDYYQVTDDRLKNLADSTVALLKTSAISVSNGVATLKGHNYGAELNLCSTEKYREQDTAAFCSGTLVAPDTILTAGHCIQTMADCQSVSFVFGFAVKAVGVLPKAVPSNEVYKCREIIKQQKIDTGADFAVIKLDRAVTNHQPVPVRPSGEISNSDGLIVIGYPEGLPLKITTGGTVRSSSQSGFFLANLDTYSGNSGSAVINSATGLIEGVLVRGENDFVQNGNCAVSQVCAEGTCRGEDVTKISSVRPFLPALNGPIPIPDPPPGPVPNPNEQTFNSVVNSIIPDNSAAGINNSLQVSAVPNGKKVYVSVQIKHPYIGDLVVKVTAPDGKSVVLHQRAGGSSQDLNKSFEVTSKLGAVKVSGAYKITVQDLALRDVGTLVSWGIQFK